jgi:hypothetical protein
MPSMKGPTFGDDELRAEFLFLMQLLYTDRNVGLDLFSKYVEANIAAMSRSE